MNQHLRSALPKDDEAVTLEVVMEAVVDKADAMFAVLVAEIAVLQEKVDRLEGR